jgi:hypothetical protein
VIDVAALAVEQMRAARDLQTALEGGEWWTVRAARRRCRAANRAYDAACAAVDVTVVADDQQELFG